MNIYFVFIFSNIFHYICSAALDQSLLVWGCCVLCNVLVCKIWDIFKHAQFYLCISGSYGFKQVQYRNFKFEFIIITDFDYSPEYVRLACFCPVMRNSVLCANESSSPNVFMFLWNNHLYVRNQAHTGWDKIWKYFWVRNQTPSLGYLDQSYKLWWMNQILFSGSGIYSRTPLLTWICTLLVPGSSDHTEDLIFLNKVKILKILRTNCRDSGKNSLAEWWDCRLQFNDTIWSENRNVGK